MRKSIERLIKVANGRQIVVPLSGGYDSRAIALYLKESGYPSIQTFTFGKKSSPEVSISRDVAESLGLEWHFVEYSWRLWNQLKDSLFFEHYLDFTSSFISVPNVQVLPAIRLLLDNGTVEKNAIVVPGHTGDFVSGGHIPETLVGRVAQHSEDSIVDAILVRHFWGKSRVGSDTDLREKLRCQIDKYIQNLSVEYPAPSVYEAWEFAERQAKFVANSNRYYDVFELNWWMPLWDNDVAEYWMNAPMKDRINSTFWRKFVSQKSRSIVNNFPEHGNAVDRKSWFSFFSRRLLDYFFDPNCLYALVPFHRWLLRKLQYRYANGNVFAYLSEKVIFRQKKLLELANNKKLPNRF